MMGGDDFYLVAARLQRERCVDHQLLSTAEAKIGVEQPDTQGPRGVPCVSHRSGLTALTGIVSRVLFGGKFHLHATAMRLMEVQAGQRVAVAF
mmetsp:Transcript_19545/g.62678  ORF Transcript_19545/g.62678 Transcript_19545/m.62678 type:complete len:93 (-) Transcript_19545:365-643(-)